MEQIAEIRDAVARALEQRGLDNREFLRQIRTGEQDDGPYMTGAIACATVLAKRQGAR
ncbi:hypothetical protein [Novosphingobium sp. ST904]|uniref:hypothetical protein n=1 Tax=Novosphingobium sp. ST904 TaxID=1684385 RepID=UPI000A5FB75D|nr:hypothetical protein [Novosphingobium sp. ST904]TCM43307.1 hypothetical protein EDF59_101411 [Novosphingobium sp. ST904]